MSAQKNVAEINSLASPINIHFYAIFSRRHSKMSFSRKDIEELKPAIERCAQKLLGSDNSAIVNLALTCLERGYDKKKASCGCFL